MRIVRREININQPVRCRTWVSDDSKLSVCLLDLKLRGSGGYPQGVVVGGINNHFVMRHDRQSMCGLFPETASDVGSYLKWSEQELKMH